MGMQFFQVSSYNEEQFLRLRGVKRGVFCLMVEVVGAARVSGGRPCKLSVEDQVLATLSYWREYRTQFHIAGSFGVSESTICRTIPVVENAWLGAPRFHLPGKKALHNPSQGLVAIVVDATEQPVERPPKNSDAPTPARKSATPRRRRS